MISNKDLRVEGSNLIINGEKHPLDPAVIALAKRANIVQGKLSALDTKLDAIEALEKTASGNPISITGAAAAYAMSNIMTIEPIQDLHGYSKPWAEGGGKNLLQCSFTDGSSSGMAWTANKDSAGNVESVTLNGTYSASSRYFLKLMDIYLEAGSYYLSGAYNAYAALEVDGNGISVVNNNSSVPTSLTIPTTGTYAVYIAIANNQHMSNAKLYPMIRKASETDATFEPYSNICPISGLTSGEVETTDGTDTNTATITFGQTVYGGSVNFKTGEVTVTHKMVDLGTLEWHFIIDRFTANLIDNKTIGDREEPSMVCSAYPTTTWYYGIRHLSEKCVYLNNNTLGANDSSYTDATAFKTAMSGVQLCYELATPITLTLTPAKLELLKGNNTVSGNGANINLSYIGR